MALNPRTSRIVPIALGVAMLAVIVAAGLSPQTGAVSAQGNCEYNQCVAGTGLQWWVFAAIAILIVAALAAALVLLRRRRPPPPSGVPAAGAAGGPTVGAMGGTSPPPAPAPEYMEMPEDVGMTLPAAASATVAGAPPPPPTAPPPPPPGAAGEQDIDSLMAELDKISGEILKRPKGGDKPPPPEE
jgi:hypothetical protein